MEDKLKKLQEEYEVLKKENQLINDRLDKLREEVKRLRKLQPIKYGKINWNNY